MLFFSFIFFVLSFYIFSSLQLCSTTVSFSYGHEATNPRQGLGTTPADVGYVPQASMYCDASVALQLPLISGTCRFAY
jgi:hypothetical protein